MYTMTACAFYERTAHTVELLSLHAHADSVYVDNADDLITLVQPEEDVPLEPGIYCLQYAIRIHFHQDYWCEWNADSELLWNNVKKLSDAEGADLLRSLGLYEPNESITAVD